MRAALDRLALAAVLGLGAALGASCIFSLPDVVTPGPDGGSGGGDGAVSTGAGAGGGDAGAGGGGASTGTVVVDCSWKAGTPPCGCYNGAHSSFYCGHAVIGAASGFYDCVPPALAFQHPDDLLSCDDAGWSVGTMCTIGCEQQTGTSAPDLCSTSTAICGCYKDTSTLLACGHAVAARADYAGCVPTPLAIRYPGALLQCDPGDGGWSVAQMCAKGCQGAYADAAASDTCCK